MARPEADGDWSKHLPSYVPEVALPLLPPSSPPYASLSLFLPLTCSVSAPNPRRLPSLPLFSYSLRPPFYAAR